MAIIKRYYLKGVMPNWEQLKYWNNFERHLDLFLFLWLHPSWDNEVLVPLREAYINSAIKSEFVQADDVFKGIGYFLNVSFLYASGSGLSNYEVKKDKFDYVLMHTDGHNEQFYDLCIGLGHKDNFPHIMDNILWKRFREHCTFYDLHTLGQWLCLKNELNKSNLDLIYQYDQPLEVWYYCVNLRSDYLHYNELYMPLVLKALYRIYHFDTQKEGNTPRTCCVNKLKKILDEREFTDQDFSGMLKQIQAGNVGIENPWES